VIKSGIIEVGMILVIIEGGMKIGRDDNRDDDRNNRRRG